MIEVSKEEQIILKIHLEGEDAAGFIQDLTQINILQSTTKTPTLLKIFEELKNI